MALKIQNLRSSNYMVTIFGGAKPAIRGIMITPPSFATQAKWDSALQNLQTGPGGVVGDVVKLGASQLGLSLNPAIATKQIYAGTELIEISLTIGLLASEDPQKEVVGPFSDYLAIPAPSSVALVVTPPVKAGTLYTIATSWFTAPEMVPVMAQVQPENVLHKGLPISAQVTMTFRTSEAIDAKKVKAWFPGAGGGPISAGGGR